MTSVSQARRIERLLGGTCFHLKNVEGAKPMIRQVRLDPCPSAAKVAAIPHSSFGRTTALSANSAEARLTVTSSDSS